MLVVDIQGFNIPSFTPKEMTISDGERTSHFLFKPPFPFHELEPNLQRQAAWISKFRHGLRWQSGFVDLSEIDNILLQATDRDNVIYCKGSIQTQYLRQHTSVPVHDVDLQDILVNGTVVVAPLPPLAPPCFAHFLNNCLCSLNNVILLYDHLN